MHKLVLIVVMASLVGCGQNEGAYQYTELILNEPVPENGSLTWQVPMGWRQEAGNDLRLASFVLVEKPQAFDCSIVSLPKMAGGVRMNLKRWMGQIQLEVTDEELDQFIAASADGIFDFTKLQKDKDPQTPSMIAAMRQIGGNTVFVKMTASMVFVRRHKQEFLGLAKSIHLKNP